MNRKHMTVLLVVLAALAASELSAQELTPPVDTMTLRDPVVISGVRVFDGEAVIPSATVVLADGLVARVALPGEDVDAPEGAVQIDGTGKTLYPGLIDAHTHTFNRTYLKSAIHFGVMAHLDMFTSLVFVDSMKAEAGSNRSADRPDLFSAGTLVTAAGGHGTQYGVPIPTLDDPADADAFIEARLAEGSDFIKIIIEDGSAFGISVNPLSPESVYGAVEAAHARGALAVAHVGKYEDALLALEAGADGLVHTFAERMPGPEFAELVGRTGAFVVPTLVVQESVAGAAGGAELVADEVIGPDLEAWQIQNLEFSFPQREGTTLSMENAYAAVRAVIDAGGTVLAGSDAPNPGTALGASMHREMRLLVEEVGMTPVEALTAATSAAADAFRLEGRGRIVEGGRADVVLVQGDPTTDIYDSRRIEAIWKEGRRWMLEWSRAVVRERRGN